MDTTIDIIKKLTDDLDHLCENELYTPEDLMDGTPCLTVEQVKKWIKKALGMRLRPGNRVRYIHEDIDNIRASGFYPPIGTLGTVVDVDYSFKYPVIEVQWDSGTNGDGVWWCYVTDVEYVEEE